MLMAETREEYESMFMAHKKKILDAVRVSVTDAEKRYKDYLVGNSASPPSTASPPAPSSPNSSASTSSTPPCVPSSAASTGGISEPAATTSTPASAQDISRAHSTSARPGVENFRPRGASPTRSAATSLRTATSARVPAAAQLDSTSTIVPAATAMHETADLRSVPPTTCSTVCLGGDMSATATPASPTTVYTMLPSPAEIEDVHDAVDLCVADLAASTPTTCSAECPSVYPVVLIPSATPNLSTNACHVVPELVAPAVSAKALDVDAMSDTTPTAVACLPAGPDHNMPPRNLPRTPLMPLILPELFTWLPTTCSPNCSCHNIETASRLLPEAYTEFNIGYTVITIVPWPPPSCTRAGTSLSYGQDLCHNAQQKRGKGFLVVGAMGSPLTRPVQDVKYTTKENIVQIGLK